MVIDAWSRYFVELLSRLVCQHTISFHTLLCMTFHIIGPWSTKILGVWKFVSSSRGISRFKRGSVIVHNIFAYITLALIAAQVYMIKERCWFSQINFIIEYFPHRINIFFPASLMSSAYTDKNNPISRCTNEHSQLETFSQPFCSRNFSNCFSHNTICVVVDESKCLDIPIWEFSIICEHPSFLPG